MTLTSLWTLPSLLLPALMLLGAATSGLAWRWPIALTLGGAALLASVLALARALSGTDAGALVSPTMVSPMMGVVIAVIGLVIVQFSRRHLRGEPRAGRFLGSLQATLAAVQIVVLTDHMLVLVAGWVAISLGLHQLLLFYPDRPRAVLAAHKKFLLARLAELCLLAAVLLLYAEHGSWRISTVMAAYPGDGLGLGEHAAAVLLALAALIKCAQMPVHGWLMQVVEAPTPVSALLHAGIINLGGYLLILFGPLLLQAQPAQWLVLVVAGLTAVVAALVMATRVSVKVKLAWSTCAQMGLMLVECALGLYELALLHLAAHACYKAAAFLNAGAAVDADVAGRLAPAGGIDRRALAGAVVAAFSLTALVVAVAADSGPYAPWVIVAAALTIVFAERRGGLGGAVLVAAVLVSAYLAQKAAAGHLVAAVPVAAGGPADLWISALAIVLLAATVLLRLLPDAAAARWARGWLFAGLYLDEWFTRATLRLWPVRLPRQAPVKRPPSTAEEVIS